MFRLRFLILIVAVTCNRALAAPEVRVWQTVGGSRLEASLFRTEGDKVILQRKNSSVTVTVMREQLVAADTVYLDELAKKQTTPQRPNSPGTRPDGEAKKDGVPAPPGKALYPRTKDEIRTGLEAILKRDKPKEVSKEVHAAVCRLNVYRFLSGVFDNVVSEPEMNEGAAEAARACAQAGKISHDLGHSTEKCNLSLGHNDMASPVDGYIMDPFENNRAQRGHRRSCLMPSLAKSGFGKSGKFGAMWSVDSSGQKSEGPWSYPGHGLYPLQYLRSESWSFYMPTPLPQDTKVRIWKLAEAPKVRIPWEEEPRGREISVRFTHVFANAVNFEPDSSILGRRGIFWIRIQGSDLREQYVTELF